MLASHSTVHATPLQSVNFCHYFAQRSEQHCRDVLKCAGKYGHVRVLYVIVVQSSAECFLERRLHILVFVSSQWFQRAPTVVHAVALAAWAKTKSQSRSMSNASAAGFSVARVTVTVLCQVLRLTACALAEKLLANLNLFNNVSSQNNSHSGTMIQIWPQQQHLFLMKNH